MFSESSPCLLVEHGSCSTAQRQGELSENILHNLFHNLMPQTVFVQWHAPLVLSQLFLISVSFSPFSADYKIYDRICHVQNIISGDGDGNGNAGEQRMRRRPRSTRRMTRRSGGGPLPPSPPATTRTSAACRKH